MSDEKDDGGPAFACPETDINYWQSGMSLRDYFAAAALTGMLADGTLAENDELAINAFAVADAMLAARKAKQP